MRAREFTINVPISIKINGDGNPEVDSNDPAELDDNPTMVPPLQQGIELQKAAAGKLSPVIQKLTRAEEKHDNESGRLPFAERRLK